MHVASFDWHLLTQFASETGVLFPSPAGWIKKVMYVINDINIPIYYYYDNRLYQITPTNANFRIIVCYDKNQNYFQKLNDI